MPGVVYIIDDDVSFHTATRQRLELAGYEVQTYSSAEQFLDQQRGDGRLGCLSSMSAYRDPTARSFKPGCTKPLRRSQLCLFPPTKISKPSYRRSRPVRKIFWSNQ